MSVYELKVEMLWLIVNSRSIEGTAMWMPCHRSDLRMGNVFRFTDGNEFSDAYVTIGLPKSSRDSTGKVIWEVPNAQYQFKI